MVPFFRCLSGSSSPNVGNLIGPHGTDITFATSDPFLVIRGGSNDPGTLLVRKIRRLVSEDSGIYTYRSPDENGDIVEFHFGVYPSSNISILWNLQQLGTTICSGGFRGGGGGGVGGLGGQNPPSALEFKKLLIAIADCLLQKYIFFPKKCSMFMHANSDLPFTKSLDPPLICPFRRELVHAKGRDVAPFSKDPCFNGCIQGVSVMFSILSHAGAPYCPTIEHVVTNKVHTLSCVSYGSPPTQVIWERDGERIYFNDTSSDIYHPNQVLLNRTTSAYNNTLTINATIEDVNGNYSCTVLNSVGQSDRLFKTVQGE